MAGRFVKHFLHHADIVAQIAARSGGDVQLNVQIIFEF
jgi:hypothetical protein